tara:strand:+ start:1416 stop:2360 length:945 start_codon:yes stop_codon:yes gene_type:complete
LSITQSKVVIQLAGGLGNQLFQYSFARSLALRNDVPLWLDISSFKRDFVYKCKFNLDQFNIKTDKIIQNSYCGKDSRITNKLLKIYQKTEDLLIPFHKKFFLSERCLSVKSTACNLSFKEGGWVDSHSRLIQNFQVNKTVILDGSFQSPAYFDEFAPIIKQDLSLKTYPQSNTDTLKQIRETDSVCVGVRRYSDGNASDYHYICERDFYQKAFERMQSSLSNPHYFIFTLEPNWVMKNLKIPGPFTIVGAEDDRSKATNDFEQMLECKHFIMSNSTYYWWAAWLSSSACEKVIIAPRLGWANKDTIPYDWILID